MDNKNNASKQMDAGIIIAGLVSLLLAFLLYSFYGDALDAREDSRESYGTAYAKLADPGLRTGKAQDGRNAGPSDEAVPSGRSGTGGQQAAELPMVRLLRPADTLSAGVRFSGAVTDDGHVLFSGADFHDEDEIAGWNDVVSVSVCGELFAGLKSDSTVLIANWHAKPAYPVDVSDWEDIVQVSVGSDFVVGLRADGTLVSAGIDGYGETKVDTPEWTGTTALDTGWQHTAGLDMDGGVHVAGYHGGSLLAEIEEHADEWTDIVEITTGGSTGSAQKGSGHIVGLRSDDSYGQCAVSAGFGFTLRLKSAGTVEAAGNKNDHQADVSDWTGVRLPAPVPG